MNWDSPNSSPFDDLRHMLGRIANEARGRQRPHEMPRWLRERWEREFGKPPPPDDFGDPRVALEALRTLTMSMLARPLPCHVYHVGGVSKFVHTPQCPGESCRVGGVHVFDPLGEIRGTE